MKLNLIHDSVSQTQKILSYGNLFHAVLKTASSVAGCLLETNSVLSSNFSSIFTKEKLKEIWIWSKKYKKLSTKY